MKCFVYDVITFERSFHTARSDWLRLNDALRMLQPVKELRSMSAANAIKCYFFFCLLPSNTGNILRGRGREKKEI